MDVFPGFVVLTTFEQGKIKRTMFGAYPGEMGIIT